MAKRTARQELEFQMQKMRDMGITVTALPAPGIPSEPERVVHIIAEAAKVAGIYYEKESI